MTLIEQVAQAMWTAREQTMPTRTRMNWSDGTDIARHVMLQQARAAIRAMREPTEKMVEAGEWPAEDDGALACWQAMIDAALGEE